MVSTMGDDAEEKWVEERNEEEEEEGEVLDDSSDDPTFDIAEEAQSSLSKLSMRKSRVKKCASNDSSGDESEVQGMDIPALNEKDEKCFEQIEKIIKGGLLETLKVDHCKIYLRKYGLRLTGKKDILLDRIKEHLEILDGNGEKKYPVSSFEIDCRGDACTGDVVLFEQNVYEMFSIASRSATAPSCGTRLVAGRIVKESYGMAKQQHTFTVEVLWSKGVKPWPPLHPLLIKGRNLYRLQTKRQRWADENERKKALDEKHSRGNVARSSREARIQQKQERKNLAGSTR
ncbi:hypothetical protein AMTR_s00007p00265400 [Amborella trichopoda]|uniref:SAP domain-containing protein n=3 Tax=Amborella trichopoda TaxID=13333 RepID=W1PC69_AMBTC|nr:hypothetical protein AMTR_s00007p00265400 [Amborella trichopoda]